MLQTLQKEYETSKSGGIHPCNIVTGGCIYRRGIDCVRDFVKKKIIIIIIIFLLKYQIGAFCKVELAKCTFFAFFCENICICQKKVVPLHRKTKKQKFENMNMLLKYGLNVLMAIIFGCLAAFECSNDAYGTMVMDLAVAFFNCFAILFIQNSEKIETLKEIEEELKQQHTHHVDE